MPAKNEAILGLYNIECAACGITVKSNQIEIGPVTKLPFCFRCFIEENYDVPTVIIKESEVPIPSKKPVDKFKTYSTPE